MKKQPVDPSVYLTMIRCEFEARKLRNSRYSLRSFAKFMRVDASYLSKVLSARVAPSQVLINQFLTHRQSGKLETQVHESHLPEMTVVEDHSEMRSRTWQHLALLSLTGVVGFKPEASWIAERLGIEIERAERCMKDVLHDGLMLVDDDGSWKKGTQSVKFNFQDPSADFLNFQEQISHRAEHSLLHGAPERRLMSTIIFSMDASAGPGAKDLIQNFRRMMLRVLSEYHRPHGDVYAMQVSLSPLTQETYEKKSKLSGQ